MNGFFQNSTSYFRQAATGIKQVKSINLSTLWKVFSLMGKRERILALLLFSTAIVSLFFSVKNFYLNHTYASPSFGGTYTEGVVGQPVYINPLLSNTEPDLTLTKLVFSGLYKYGQNGQLEPDLAEGMPQISEDQKQYTVNLRPDVKWHNNRQLTADDVVFTIQLLKDPSFKSPLRPLWQTTNVEKLSDYSVKFTTKDVSGPFLSNLTLGILPKSVWNGIDSQNFSLSKLNLEAIGSGPFSIAEINKLPSGKIQQIALQSHANYYNGKPKIDRAVFKFYDTEDDLLNAFHSREIDGFGFIPLGSNLYVNENQPKAQLTSVSLPQHQVVFFNINHKNLMDQKVRQALSLATNKEQIIDQVFKSHALLPSSPFLLNDGQPSTPLVASTDGEQAKKILDEAGWKLDAQSNLRTNKNIVFEITISTNDSPVNSKAAEILADQWRALGLKINLSVLPGKQLIDEVIKPRSFDVLLFPQKFGTDPDPFLFWHSSQVKDPGYNLTGFKDQQADKLITDARTTTDKTQRAEEYQKLSDLILSKYPVIFLDQTQFIYAVDNKIKNVKLGIIYDPSQRFNDVINWYIEEKRTWK